MNISIAIDGPGGAGKSTVAKELAAKLGILHLDTGAMYRAFAWQAKQQGVDASDEDGLAKLTESVEIKVLLDEAGQRTFTNGEDVTTLIRTEEIGKGASDVSRFAAVRRFMVRMQQEMAKSGSIVLDGRDIGTVVLPNATLKIFLTASPEERAKRRFQELSAKGVEACYEKILEDITQRDFTDMNREVDPLRAAEDAVTVDTSAMTQREVVEHILTLLAQKQVAAESQPTAPVQKPEKFTFIYRVIRFLSRVVFHTLFPVQYHRAEKAQMDAPYILIANHSSMLDPLIAGWLSSRYQIRFFGKKELVKNPLLKLLLDNARMIPVDRHHMDMAAVRACMKTLKEGHPLCIFPEGTRHKDGVMEDLESGVAVIALRANVPLLPAYISDKPRLFRKIHCYYGDPISVDELAAGGVGKENCDVLLEKIREVYARFQAEHQAFMTKSN